MVSVVIPTYNRANTILRSVESVLNQTYKDIELIIVDDCSNDNTEQIVKKIFDPRVRYIKFSENKGACAARNAGIDAALGDYIAFQDSDDVWRKNKLACQMNVLQTEDVNVVVCAIERHNYGKKTEVFPRLESGIKSYHDIVMGFFVSTQMIIGKKNVFEKYRFDENLPRMQDYDLIVRIAKTEKIYFINKVLVDVFMQEDSISAKTNKPSKIEEISAILLEKYSDMAEEFPEWRLEMLKRIAHNRMLQGIKCDDVLREIYRTEPTIANAVKLALSKTGLLKPALKLIDSRK